MACRLAIFDMDGTILDTLEDLRDSLNLVLAGAGLPTRSLEQVRCAVGNGIFTLIARSVPPQTKEQRVLELYQQFMPHYQAHCQEKTRPYPGIVPLLRQLRERGILCAVLSNKADSAVQELCRVYYPDCFHLAAGERQGIPRKPAPEPVWAILSELGIPREEAVYIGDSEVDYATAKNAGVDCILVTWGFRSRSQLSALGAERLADSPQDCLSLLS